MKKLITLILVLNYFNAHSQFCLPNTNSIQFNGTSDYVGFNSQTNLDPTTAITVEAWVYASQFATNVYENTIFCKHSGGTPVGKSGYVLRAGGNGIFSFVFCGDSAGAGISADWFEVASPAASLSLNTWTHVAGTFDGTHAKLYKNGVLIKDSMFTGTIKPSPCTAMIGRLSDSTAAPLWFWNGKIDEVRVWDRALSQTEIFDSMDVQITASAQSGLVGYWQMNDGTGTVVTDASASGNNGTKTTPTWSTAVPFTNAPPVPVIQFTGVQLFVLNSCPNYQWYLNGNIIPGATGQVYNPLTNGTYTCVDTNAHCSATSIPVLVSTLSINENESNNFITLYPNSVSDELHIRISNNVFHSLDISDITGRIIFHRANVSSEMIIDVHEFSKGIYIAKFSGNGVTAIKRFIVD